VHAVPPRPRSSSASAASACSRSSPALLAGALASLVLGPRDLQDRPLQALSAARAGDHIDRPARALDPRRADLYAAPVAIAALLVVLLLEEIRLQRAVAAR